MMSEFFLFQHTLNRLFNNCIYKVILKLHNFFLKYEGEVKLTPAPHPPPPPPFQEKPPSKSPALLGLIIIKLPFVSKNMSKFFLLPPPSKTCALPFDFALERDPKNIFYYQRDLYVIRTRSSIFLSLDRHECIHTESSGLQFWSVYLCYGFI